MHESGGDELIKERVKEKQLKESIQAWSPEKHMTLSSKHKRQPVVV
jgi:hypothetical protein